MSNNRNDSVPAVMDDGQYPSDGREPGWRGLSDAGKVATPKEVTGLSQAFIESVFDVVREPVLVLDAELTVVSANAAYLGHFRVSQDETVDRRLLELGNGQWDIPGLHALLEGVLSENREFKDLEVQREFEAIGHRTVLLAARKLVHLDGRSTALVLFIEDVTERQLTTALLESERRFRQVIDALPVAIYTTDAEGSITHANPASIRLTGREPSPDTDRWSVSWKLFMADGTPLPNDKCPMAVALKEGRVLHGGEYLVERPDGTRRWFCPYPTPIRDADGEVIGGINMLVDITERKEMEEERREEDLRYRSLVEQVKDYAIFRTDPRGIATTWNEGVRRLFGFDEQDFIGKDVAHLIFTKEDVLKGVPELELVQAAQVGQVSNDRWMRRKDGSRFYAMGVTSALRDDDGVLVGYTKVKRDQTTQKRLEDDLRQSSAELSEADRRKNEFLATLAHELRNPLAPMQNALRVMKLSNDDADAVRAASGLLERQVDHMVRLVDDLLDVSRISRGTITLRRERTNLASIIETVVETARPHFDGVDQEVSLALPSHPVYVNGDPVRLSQVVGNLLNNACKFTGEDGRIALTLESDGRQAILTVQDSGIGISAEHLTRVFDLFTQVDTSLERSAGGLGIGLALVKNMVEQHGGTVTAASDGAGRGSRFVVRLPIMTGALESAISETPDGGTSPVATVLRILVADDNLDSAESLSILLKLDGHEIHTAADGVEAVEAAEKLRPHVVILDIGMPRLNGFEACRAIRKQPWGESILLVALSGWAQDEDRRKSKEAGFNAHLVKPLQHEALLKLLATVDTA